MDLMKRQMQDGEIPEDISIRCVSYGAPPVYESPEGTTHPNIFAVYNNHDGLGWYNSFYMFKDYDFTAIILITIIVMSIFYFQDPLLLIQ